MAGVRLCASMAWVGLLLVAGKGSGAVLTAEDLTGCRLPNGVAVLPAAGTELGNKGVQLKVSNKTMSAPAVGDDGKPLSAEQLVAKLRATKGADLQYLPEQSGLWAFSGCITEISGVAYLSDSNGQKLDEPLEIPHNSRNPGGLYTNIREGRVYLLATTDKHFAMLRVLEINKKGMVVQYVYQPDGSTKFDVPVNPTVRYQTPADGQAGPDATLTADVTGGSAGSAYGPAATGPSLTGAPETTRLPPMATRPPTTFPGVKAPTLGPNDYMAPGIVVMGPTVVGPASGTVSSAPDGSMDAFNRQRAALIQRQMDIVRAPASASGEIEAKAQAINNLALLHADDAADLLVSQISFLNTRSTAKEFSAEALHPCIGALTRLGKPATAAVIKGIKQLDLTAGDGIDSDRYKVELLSMVIQAVEGKDVAGFILRRELEAEKDGKRRAALIYVLNKIPPQP